jgi:molybdate transport system ATP-binding protein
MEDLSLYLPWGGATARVHWEIRDDQHWAVVGPNGSGKSRLVKAIASPAPIAGGVIRYHFVRNGGSPHDRVAYVSFESQTAGLPCDSPFHQARWNRGVGQRSWSVSDYLSEYRVNRVSPFQVVDGGRDSSGFEAYRQRIIELLGIKALLYRSIDQVSNGERRKVLLARALLRRPQLLILDNPFAGLDVAFRERLQHILETLMQDDLRIILVTNGRESFPPGITHVLLMDRGEVIAQGPREEMLQALHALVARCATRRNPGGALPVMRVDAGAERAGAVVRMRNVTVAYGGLPILQDINWSVSPGEKWALLGPNGAGKTTLLSLILGDNPQAYANDIALFGSRLGPGRSIWEIKKRIGWVAPELQLYYPKTVPCLEVVCSGFHSAMGPYRRCTTRQRETSSEWLHKLGLGDLTGVALGALSEGQQRMVLVARALVDEPELLIFDEPCQGLDAANRDQVLGMVEGIDEYTAASLIYVSHHRDALPRGITHVLRLDGGRVVGRQGVRDEDLNP